MVDLIHKYVYADRPREKAAPSIINGCHADQHRRGAQRGLDRGPAEAWFQSEGLVDADITIDRWRPFWTRASSSA